MLLLTPEEKNTIAEENFNLIHYVANSFSTTGIPHDELVSIGTVGYTKALNNYDKDSEAKFSTYAVTCIRNEILHFLRKEKKHTENTILSGTYLFTDKDGNALTVDDTLSNEMKNKINDEVYVEDLILFKEDLAILMEAIKKLPKREQMIVINRYGLNGGKVLTQVQIGNKLGMSQANVSKLEQGILEKLAKELKGKIKLEENGFYIDYYKKEKQQEVLEKENNKL